MSSHGEILVFEDFDYEEGPFDSSTFGGGIGFAAESAWINTSNNATNLARKHLFDGTPNEIPLDGETWDGVFNGLPSSPNHAGLNIPVGPTFTSPGPSTPRQWDPT